MNEFLQPREGPNAEKAMVIADNLRDIHREMSTNIEKGNKRIEY